GPQRSEPTGDRAGNRTTCRCQAENAFSETADVLGLVPVSEIERLLCLGKQLTTDSVLGGRGVLGRVQILTELVNRFSRPASGADVSLDESQHDKQREKSFHDCQSSAWSCYLRIEKLFVMVSGSSAHSQATLAARVE